MSHFIALAGGDPYQYRHYRKSYMSFRLVQKSKTLNDLERRNSPNGTVISSHSVVFWADYVKVVEDTKNRYFLRRKCSPKNVVFSGISLMAILQEIASSESVKVRHSVLASENLTNNQP